MRFLILFLAFAAAFARASGQNVTQAKIDSLEKVVAATNEDTTKARSLCRLCRELGRAGQMEAAGKMAETGLRLARMTGDRNGEALCLYKSGLLYRDAGDLSRALERMRTSLKIMEETGDRGSQARALNSIGIIYAMRSDYAPALEYFRKSLRMYERVGDRAGQADALNSFGVVCGLQAEYARAAEYYRRSLKIKEEIGDLFGVANALNNIGLVYLDQGNYASALDYLQKSLTAFEKYGDRAGAANALTNIGNIYSEQEDYRRGLRYYLKSLNIREEIGDQKGAAYAMHNIGVFYSQLGDYARALDYFQKSLNICERAGDRNGAAEAMVGVGSIRLERGEYARALDYFQKSLKIYEETNKRNNIANTLAKIAALKLKTGQPVEARKLSGRALEIALEIGAPGEIQFAAETRSQADSALGDWKSAYEHHKLFKQYTDSLRNDAQSKEIGRLEAQYAFEKETEAREQAERAAAERRALYIWAAAGAFAALLLIAGALAWGYRAKRQANKQLALQNEEIRQQSEEIRQQNDLISTMNEGLDEALAELRELSQFKESMTGMLVHDLKNPLSVVMGYAERFGAEAAPLKAAALQMNGLTMNMLDVQKFESAGVNLELKPALARNIAAAALEQVAFLAEEKNIALHNEADPGLHILADESYMVRVLVNLLNNAVKFTPYGGTIRVSATESESGFAELAVTDSGAGIPEDKLDAVFDKFSKLEDKAGLNKQGTGLGLTFCKLAAEAHGGAIRAENAPEGGARFRLTLPRADASADSLPVITGEPEPACAPPELTAADKAALAPVLAAIRRYEIYEMSEIASALEALDENASPALAAWRRRLEGALYELDEQAFTAVLREAEADG